jgi:hypothetical protein
MTGIATGSATPPPGLGAPGKVDGAAHSRRGPTSPLGGCARIRVLEKAGFRLERGSVRQTMARSNAGTRCVRPVRFSGHRRRPGADSALTSPGFLPLAQWSMQEHDHGMGGQADRRAARELRDFGGRG